MTKYNFLLKIMTIVLVFELSVLGTYIKNMSDTLYSYYDKNLELDYIRNSSKKGSLFGKIKESFNMPPVNIKSDKIGLNLKVISLGVTPTGELDTPQNWNEAGWYKGSAKAGEKGNIIINAHYDDSSGRPAGFWMLKNIVPGDKVVLLDKYARTYEYEVKDTFFVDINDPNRLEILKNIDNGESVLTMITCGGFWIPGQGTYNKRLVVKAHLVL